MTNKKTYIREFKEAVRFAQQNGNISETTLSLGVHDSILRRWKKELEDHQEKAFSGTTYLLWYGILLLLLQQTYSKILIATLLQ